MQTLVVIWFVLRKVVRYSRLVILGIAQTAVLEIIGQKRGDKMKKQIKFCISFNEEFYKKLKRCAAQKQMSIACYIRQAIMEYMKGE